MAYTHAHTCVLRRSAAQIFDIAASRICERKRGYYEINYFFGRRFPDIDDGVYVMERR